MAAKIHFFGQINKHDEKMQIYDLGEINTLNKKATVKIECIGRNPLSAGTAFLL